MDKKYTVMVFNENRYNGVKNLKISMRAIQLVMISVFVYVLISGFSFYFLHDLYSKRNTLLQYKQTNVKLKGQIASYSSRLSDIRNKIAKVDKLKSKFANITKDYKFKSDKKTLALGGTEVDIEQNLSAIADSKQKEYLIELSDTLATLGMELDKRTMALSELSDILEERKLLMNSTPSIWPVKGWITSSFGFRKSPFTGGRVFHAGLDIANRRGTPIKTTAKGVVIFAGWKSGYGNMMVIDHGYSFVTQYGHCDKLLKKAGDVVEKGDTVALVGNSGRSTGPHVHYEVLVNGVPVNPLKFIIDDEI